MPDRVCLVCRIPLAPGAGVERFHRSRSRWRNGRLEDGLTPYYHCDKCWADKGSALDRELDKLSANAKLLTFNKGAGK